MAMKLLLVANAAAESAFVLLRVNVDDTGVSGLLTLVA
jgi:hypothetical protein